MTPPLAQKYQRILQADPRSRIFVELARTLLEAGDATGAAEACRRGVGYHPDSIQGRILYGRALLTLGRIDEALQRFEEAVAIDPANPYAFDLAGEALVGHGLAEQALPLLWRATQSFPHDSRVQRWLEEARRMAPDAASSLDTAIADGHPPEAPAISPPAPGELQPSDPSEAAAAPAPESPETPAPPALDDAASRAAADPPGTPDAAPPPLPPPLRKPTAPQANRFLDLLPDAPAPTPAPVTAAATTAVKPTTRADEERAATEAARTYEYALREKIRAAAPKRPGFLHRNAKWLAATGVVLAIVGGIAIFAWVRRAHRVDDARAAVTDARKGFARDTVGALREAARVLEGARHTLPHDDTAAALATEIAALLAHDYGDESARATASQLLSTGRAGEGAFAARVLLAPDDTAAATALLDHAAEGTPLARTIAGQLLLARHDLKGARRQLEAAARATPPLLRALTALGDLELAQGNNETALERYTVVLKAHPKHPRAALGAAEARLHLGRDVAESLHTLQAIDADPATSAPPREDRLRLDLTMARLLAANGQLKEAERRLTEASTRAPDRAEISATQADVLALSGEVDRAISATSAALRLTPRDVNLREKMARLQLRRGRYRELLAATEDAPSRALRLYRGIAQLGLGEPDKARAELEATRRDGKMTTEGASWMAIAELASGRRPQATALINTLLSTPAPHPVALLARGRLDLLQGDPAAAEKHFKEAIEREPDLQEARRDLGRLFLSRGKTTEARETLEKALARAPFDLEARRDLGRARLAAGDPSGAERELRAVIVERPHDLDAWIALSTADLALGNPWEARRSADHALAAAPHSAGATLAAGLAAAATGARDARHLLETAAKLGGTGPITAEAKRALARLPKR